jgi:uncharacterized protein (TIGR00730 family)
MEYPNAYQDIEFLEESECRGIRLQLEFMKPDSVMRRHNIKSTIVVFGSARTPDLAKARELATTAEARLRQAPDDPALQQAVRHAQRQLEFSHFNTIAYDFAKLVTTECQKPGACEYVIVTGGGGGIMEAANRGAADAGGVTIGLNISLPFEQRPNPYITPELCFHFRYFSMRKMHFLYRAKALCAGPGGFGTMDELFEALTLIQTHKIPPMPVILFGRSFWEKLIKWEVFVEEGLISPNDLHLFRYCDTAQEGWDYIRDYWNCQAAPTPTP